VFRKEDLDTGACCLCRLDKDELVFVGQDHGGITILGTTGRTTGK
jgi:hypothetical protein